MKLRIHPGRLQGGVEIPASKSHTIRAVAFASLASGRSTIEAPLHSADAEAAVRAYRAMGANIDTTDPDTWHVEGFAGQPRCPEDVIDVANSGTTLRIALASAALIEQATVRFTGDDQIRRRPLGPLLQSLNDLGATATSELGNDCAPVAVQGRMRGGPTSLDAVTSQYLTALLVNCPLAEQDTQVTLSRLNEKPYVAMTLHWLAQLGVRYSHDPAMSRFTIPGRQQWGGFDIRVPGDFSSATFFLAAGAMAGNRVNCRGLDMEDPQGDKAVVQILRDMGAAVDITEAGIAVRGGTLRGGTWDLNDTPDALPMLAGLATLADDEVHLSHVPQARVKETDRIDVMHAELSRMGADVEQLEDGLIIRPSQLRGAELRGHHDHRVVMALAITATAAVGPSTIDTAEAMAVTYPDFVEHLRQLGADVQIIDDV